MDILLIEPWFSGSHRAWAEGYARHSSHRVHLVTLPGRFWKWRLQGSALPLARLAESHVAEHGSPDVVLAGSMMNLPAFLGLARRWVGSVPVGLYMHENQITYPSHPGGIPDPSLGLINWMSLLAADRVFFNSEYHRRALFDALPAVLERRPDYSNTDLIEAIASRSTVLPVGIDLARLDAAGPRPEPAGPPAVLWNHRWEPDKNPEPFLRTLLALAADGSDFRVILAGEGRYADLEDLRGRLRSLALHDGYAGEEEYVGLLKTADVVVSTARQEFFGVSVVEAVYAGALPILPDRLAYPELVPPSYHDRCLYRGNSRLADRLRWAFANPAEARRAAGELRERMAVFDWSVQGPRYDAELARLADLTGTSSPQSA